MKRTISLLLVSVLAILLMLSSCENKTQASGGGVSTQSAYLEGFRPRFSTGTAFEEIAAQNPLDKAFVRETGAIANAASDEMLEVTLRYGDYWKDEMSNAFSLANGAAGSEQSISLQNEQESWDLYADDHLTLAGVMTGVRQGDDTQKNNTNALVRLNLYRTRALALYEYYYVLASSASPGGEASVPFLFQDDNG